MVRLPNWHFMFMSVRKSHNVYFSLWPSSRVLIKLHFFLKVIILLFTCVQTVPFTKKLDIQNIFEILQGLGCSLSSLHESLRK